MLSRFIPPTWKDAARRLKREVLALYFAARDPATPWAARLLAALVAAYAFSPIDLIPDMIPVLGLLDDLLLLPLGIWLVLRMVPPEVMAVARQRAQDCLERPTSRLAAGVILLLWLLAAGLLWHWGQPLWERWTA
jgi:uncharacterized membrane protein YkvA (DUF1232 family)